MRERLACGSVSHGGAACMRERRACGSGAHAGAARMRMRRACASWLARAKVCGAQAGEARM
eukprot:3661777-Pleurochrysis_carterae.AAC.1